MPIFKEEPQARPPARTASSPQANSSTTFTAKATSSMASEGHQPHVAPNSGTSVGAVARTNGYSDNSRRAAHTVDGLVAAPCDQTRVTVRQGGGDRRDRKPLRAAEPVGGRRRTVFGQGSHHGAGQHRPVHTAEHHMDRAAQ